MQKLVQFIGAMLLLMLTTTMAYRQEMAVAQEAMPQEFRLACCHINAGQVTAERTMPTEAILHPLHRTMLRHHVIDYYIYTLEHILI